jgi:GMP synthase (glutamine-hydrolysing)
MKRSLLLLETGAPPEAIIREFGDYTVRFFRAFPEFAVTRVSPFRGERVPPLKNFEAVVVTGSPLSLCTPEPWMIPLGQELRAHAEGGGAILAVCFGLQMVCAAAGSGMIKNPKGREIGTIEVDLTEAGKSDPLFQNFPKRFAVQATHTDIPAKLPAGETLLASNSNSAIQALRFGPRAWATQFHPEFDEELMRGLIRIRAGVIAKEGLDPRALEQAVRPTPWGERILHRFAELL